MSTGRRGLEEVGVGWEKVTEKKDEHGKIIGKNRWFSLKLKVPCFKDDSLMVFKQNEDKLKEKFKRELTERDPRLVVMRARGTHEKT